MPPTSATAPLTAPAHLTGAASSTLPTTKRRGRITPGQQRALDQLWAAYGVEVTGVPLDVAAVFGRVAPLVVEIGFGMGEATLEMAAADPDRDVLAVDLHTPGTGALLSGVSSAGLTNVRVMNGDARAVLSEMLAADSLDEVRVYFPDPWPKQRHQKRRLLGTSTVGLVASRLRPGGVLHVATDWTPYAEQVLEVVAAEPLLHNELGGYAPRPDHRPVTRFERQGLAKGHEVHDIVARRSPATH